MAFELSDPEFAPDGKENTQIVFPLYRPKPVEPIQAFISPGYHGIAKTTCELTHRLLFIETVGSVFVVVTAYRAEIFRSESALPHVIFFLFFF